MLFVLQDFNQSNKNRQSHKFHALNATEHEYDKTGIVN